MGLIRKSLSITTLGIIPFRSRKERLRAAESGKSLVTSALHAELIAHAEAEERLAAANARIRSAELLALREAGRAAKARKEADASKHRGRRNPTPSAAAAHAAATAATAAADTVAHVSRDVSRNVSKNVSTQVSKSSKGAAKRWAKAEKQIKAAEAQAQKTAKQLRKDARGGLRSAKKAATKATVELREEATERAGDVAARAGELLAR